MEIEGLRVLRMPNPLTIIIAISTALSPADFAPLNVGPGENRNLITLRADTECRRGGSRREDILQFSILTRYELMGSSLTLYNPGGLPSDLALTPGSKIYHLSPTASSRRVNPRDLGKEHSD